MKKKLLFSLQALAALMLIFSFAACENEGPMEKAGEDIDDAAEEVSDDVEDATDD